MKKFFGEYLVEKGLISQIQLLDALEEQYQSVPTVFEVVKQEQFLSVEQILQVIKYQYQRGVGLQQACKDLTFWNDELEKKIRLIISKKQRPLGHILMHRYSIPFEQMTNLLDDFLNEQDVAKETDSVSDNTDNYFHDLDFVDIDKEILNEYIAMLNEDKKSDLEMIVLDWEKINLEDPDDKHKLSESFRTFYREYHTIKGSARFFGGVLTERIIHKAEDVLGIIMNNLDKFSKEDIQTYSNVNLKVIDVVWDLKLELSNSGTEATLFENQSQLNSLNELYGQLDKLHKNYQERVGELDLDAVSDQF